MFYDIVTLRKNTRVLGLHSNLKPILFTIYAKIADQFNPLSRALGIPWVLRHSYFTQKYTRGSHSRHERKP